MFLSQSQFARIIGCSRQAVNEMKKNGHIIMAPDGKKVDETASIKRLKDLDRLDEDNKIKMKTKKDQDPEDNKKSPSMFDVDYPYETLSDLSEDERCEYEREKRKIIDKAKKEGIDTTAFKDFLDGGSNEKIKITDLNRIKTFYQAQNEKLKYEMTAGDLISKEQVYADQFQIARTIRDSLLGMPNRIAHELLNKKNKREVITTLDYHINKILESLGGHK